MLPSQGRGAGARRRDRSPVASYTPGFVEALRLAWRPMVAYLAFCGLGFVAFTSVVIFYDAGDAFFEVLAAVTAGLVGVVAGQLLSLFRLRVLPLWVLSCLFFFGAFWLVMSTGLSLPKVVLLAIAFFSFGFPCGLLSLQHRWELAASFWPAVGWIGSAIMILNHEGRVSRWHEDKALAWLPVPLALLCGFVVFLLLYLAAKQSMRVDLWQALSGAAQRRVQRREAVRAIPRRSLLSLLGLALSCFRLHGGARALPLAHGPGRSRRRPVVRRARRARRAPDPPARRRGAPAEMKELARAAKASSQLLWPLLLLLLLYRPTKRALLMAHLKTPIVPTPPSERIDNLWELVRIRAEDAGLALKPSDSVEGFGPAGERPRHRGAHEAAAITSAPATARRARGDPRDAARRDGRGRRPRRPHDPWTARRRGPPACVSGRGRGAAGRAEGGPELSCSVTCFDRSARSVCSVRSPRRRSPACSSCSPVRRPPTTPPRRRSTPARPAGSRTASRGATTATPIRRARGPRARRARARSPTLPGSGRRRTRATRCASATSPS